MENKKPECMTHLYKDELVYKDNPIIILRGKLDSLQAKILEVQSYIVHDSGKADENQLLLQNLEELLEYSRNIMLAEILNQELDNNKKLFGLTIDEVKTISHNTMKYFNIAPMRQLSYKDCPIAIKINMLRALSREVELAAIVAFKSGDECERLDIIKALNRLSSAFHILVYRQLAGKQAEHFSI